LFHEWRREGYLVSTDPGRLNLGVIHSFLKGSYWARGVPLEVVGRSVENSLCFGLYRGEEQVAFAREVTDRATSAYLADMFVLEEHRGRGLGKWLMEIVLSHPDLQGLRRPSLPPPTRTGSTAATTSGSWASRRSSWKGKTWTAQLRHRGDRQV
jgi:GNAT superfamily N-acetyltransferase